MRLGEVNGAMNRIASFLVLLAMVDVAHGQPSVINVCDLLKSPKRYDHKTLVATGFVYADIHSTGIEGEGCSGGVVIRYDVNSTPPGFVNGIEAKRGRLDRRRFKVTVEGQFYAQVPGPLGYIRRIEVTKVVNWGFVEEKTPTAKPMQTGWVNLSVRGLGKPPGGRCDVARAGRSSRT